MLGKRGRGTAEGLYALIGGKPDQGESAEKAIVREVMESHLFYRACNRIIKT